MPVKPPPPTPRVQWLLPKRPTPPRQIAPPPPPRPQPRACGFCNRVRRIVGMKPLP